MSIDVFNQELKTPLLNPHYEDRMLGGISKTFEEVPMLANAKRQFSRLPSFPEDAAFNYRRLPDDAALNYRSARMDSKYAHLKNLNINDLLRPLPGDEIVMKQDGGAYDSPFAENEIYTEKRLSHSGKLACFFNQRLEQTWFENSFLEPCERVSKSVCRFFASQTLVFASIAGMSSFANKAIVRCGIGDISNAEKKCAKKDFITFLGSFLCASQVFYTLSPKKFEELSREDDDCDCNA